MIGLSINIPTVICIVSAHRKQGKTQLVMRIVEGLAKEGFKVGTIKHIGGHSAYDNSNVKDTTRHSEAGAKMVIAVTQSEIISITKTKNPSLEVAINFFPKDYEFIIVEGFKKSSFPRIIIIDQADEIQGLNQTASVLGVTGHITQKKEEQQKLDQKYPIIKETDQESLVNIIKKHRNSQILSMLPGENCGDCGFKNCEEMAEMILLKKATFDKCPHLTKELSLIIDDKEIYMKDFVQNIIRKGIEGMIETLKGVPRDPRDIKIQIKSSEKK